MPNMKIEMNNDLMIQTIEKSNSMEYSEKTVKLIVIIVEDLRKITM